MLAVDAVSGGRQTPVARDPAADVIGRATDPRTGVVDTQRLANWVVEARRSDPQAAETAHAAIEQHLLASGHPGDVAHYNQDVVQAARQSLLPDQAPGGLWAAGQGMLQQGSKLLIDNPILVKRWEATTSAWTGKGGFTRGLTELLTSNGIQVGQTVHAPPPGSLGRTSGITSPVANNTNGALARDAIADRWRAAGAQVRTEVPVLNGARVVDVVAEPPATDPRMRQRIDELAREHILQ